MELNCAAIPETLFESELFGAEKGAHSTATRRIEGKVDAARGGTLFLDEVGEMPLGVQSKLLTFLQSRRYYRLGGAAPIEADVRVVAATNADLPERVQQKRFREDLYYRLNVLEVRVPPLRARPKTSRPSPRPSSGRWARRTTDRCRWRARRARRLERASGRATCASWRTSSSGGGRWLCRRARA